MAARKAKTDQAIERLRNEVKAEVEQGLDDMTGQLYNQFVAYISEARVPLYNVLVVLEIVRAEVVEQIRKRQGLI
ncbi:MAG: hypothetical protein WAO76_10315 [Georgfuchsia sp.]